MQGFSGLFKFFQSFSGLFRALQGFAGLCRAMAAHAPQALLSKAWSGDSMIEGVSRMLVGTKHEIPDDVEQLQNLIQDCSRKVFVWVIRL